MKIIQMIIEKHYNRMLRMFKASNEAHINVGWRSKNFFMPTFMWAWNKKYFFV